MRSTKLEKLLEHLVNNESGKAEDLLHEYIIETARRIYSEISEADDFDPDGPSYDLTDEIQGRLSGGEFGNDEFGDEFGGGDIEGEGFGDELGADDEGFGSESSFKSGGEMRFNGEESDIDALDDFPELEPYMGEDSSDDFDLNTSDRSGDFEDDLRHEADSLNTMNDEIETEERFNESASIYEDDDDDFGEDDEFSSFNDEENEMGGDEFGGEEEEMSFGNEEGGEDLSGGFEEMLPSDDEEVVGSDVDGGDIESSLNNVEEALDELRAAFGEMMGDDAESLEDPLDQGVTDELNAEMDEPTADEDMGDEESAGGDMDDETSDDELSDDEETRESADLKKFAMKAMGSEDSGVSKKSAVRDKLPSMRQLIDVMKYPDTDTGSEKGTEPETPKDLGVKGPQDHGAKLQNAKKPKNKTEKPVANSPIGSGKRLG